MSEQKSSFPLIIGLILVGVGIFLLWGNLSGLRLHWLTLIKFVLPVTILMVGLTKLTRHFRWDESKLIQYPGKGSLLGGIFWTFVGAILVADLLFDLDAVALFGRYWPGILILIGIGKVVDFYRFSGRLQFRFRELIGVLFIITLGVVSARVSEGHFRLLARNLPLIIGEDTMPLENLFGERYRKESEEQIPAREITGIQITNAYGDVRIEAGSGDDIRVRLTKVIRASSEEEADEIAEQIRLIATRRNDELQIQTNRQEVSNRYRFNTNLILEVPEQIPLNIVNQFGSVRVGRLKAACEVENSHGEVRVENIDGPVRIKNRYRLVRAEHVRGDLEIRNGRGAVRVADVTGKTQLTTDYDSITAERIQGDLLASNHFGSIRVSAVSGMIDIKGPGCSVSISQARQDVSVNNSHKRIGIRGVEGSLRLDTSYSRVELEDIGGPVEIRAAHSRLQARGLDAGIRLTARASSVNLAKIEGPVRIHTSLQQVQMSDFSGTVEVQNEYGDVSLSVDDRPVESLTVNNRHGKIRLTLPSDSSFRLFAQASGGEVHSDFAPVSGQARQTGMEVLNLEVGEGGPEIRLQTTYARIEIEKSSTKSSTEGT